MTITHADKIAALRQHSEWWDEQAKGCLAHSETAQFAALWRAILADLEAQQWRPIETAPKDGTVIIVARRREAHYGSNGLNWITKAFWLNDGWVGSFTIEAAGFMAPTHWMPLPPPPEEP